MNRISATRVVLASACIYGVLLSSTQAQPLSLTDPYADAVIRYDPQFGGGISPSATYQDPTRALGAPDVASPTNGITSIVSLGTFGLLELAFTNNLLTNSGTSAADLTIFEIGADVEGTSVALRPTPATALLLGSGFDTNNDGFYEVGNVSGSTDSLDIDATFTGFLPGTLRFDGIQLIDIDGERASGGTDGPDIDAVEALFSVAVPEPSSALLLGGAVGILALLRRSA